MSVYFVKGKGWRYDFTLRGTRHTGAWFKTKTEAKRSQAERKEEILNPKPQEPEEKTPTDMVFLDLVNRRLDNVKVYNSERHYKDYFYMARRWVKRWANLLCSEITQDMIEKFVLERSLVSYKTANKEIRYLRATFNYGKRKKYITNDPTDGIEFLPTEKKAKKFVPEPEEIDKVIAIAKPVTQDYLWTIRETMGRVSEINSLTWGEVDFQQRTVTLYTRKKKGGHLTPRKVPMTNRLFEILSRRYEKRDVTKPWVFWHRYWSRKENKFREGPYQDRKKIMKGLCETAGVPYFRFHPLRHFGASVMDNSNVPIGSIQRILGHENRTTTEIYLHSIGNSERNAMAVYEQVTRKSHTNPHTTKTKELDQFFTTA